MNKTMIKYTAFYLFSSLCFVKDEVNKKYLLWESFLQKVNYGIVVNGLFVVNIYH